MITPLLTLLAIAVSAVGVAHLTAVDPKRRRAFRLDAPSKPGRTGLAWAALYIPGLVLLVMDQWAAFLMWLGGAPLVGWGIAATPPGTYARLKRRALRRLVGLRQSARALRQGVAAPQQAFFMRDRAVVSSMQRQIAALEARIATLEAQLASASGETQLAPASGAQSTPAGDPDPRLNGNGSDPHRPFTDGGGALASDRRVRLWQRMGGVFGRGGRIMAAPSPAPSSLQGPLAKE